MTMRPALLGVVASVFFGSLVSGCSGTVQQPDPAAGSTVTTSSLAGRSLSEVYGVIGYTPPAAPPENLGVVTYDVSPAVTGGPASAAPGDPAAEWTVLAACYTDVDGPKLALGVIPSAGVTPDIDGEARRQGFDDLLVECADATETFTV